jgi:glycosyltransferase involved in cell wall biosynthesis
MEEILAVADLFLLTSEYESFGLAALEAMAAGVPVVSTNAGGLPEIAIQGETGFLDDVGDIQGMSDHAIQILEDEATLKRFKANALAHAKNFDIHRIVPQYEALYNHFLATEPVLTP